MISSALVLTALSCMALMMMKKSNKNQIISPSLVQAEHDEFADYHEVSEVPPFKMGEIITFEDSELVITGFRMNGEGEYLIGAKKVIRAKVKK